MREKYDIHNKRKCICKICALFFLPRIDGMISGSEKPIAAGIIFFLVCLNDTVTRLHIPGIVRCE